MRKTRIAALAAAALVSVSCSTPTATQVRVEVGPFGAQDGLGPGDPLSRGMLHLLEGDDVVFEAVLDEDGVALIEPAPGVYTLQVRLDSTADPLCFWGETVFDVRFPSPPLQVEVAFICAGG